MNIEVRKLSIKDYNDLKSSMIEAYHGSAGAIWSKTNISDLIRIFPEGQLCGEVDKKVFACALAIITDSKQTKQKHTYKEIIEDRFSTHDPEGDILYGIEVFVHPDYRSLRLGRRLYDARKELCEQMNLKGIIAGGRIPKYRSEEHTSELQSLMRISYAVFCLKKKKQNIRT